MKTFLAMLLPRFVAQGTTYSGSGRMPPGITDHDVLARAAPKVSRREIPSLLGSIHLRHRIS